MATDYKKRLKIPLEGQEKFSFFNNSGKLLATGYTRVVIGGRGPYVEFAKRHIVVYSFHILEDQKYRLTDNRVYYIESRSRDLSNVKLYFQKKLVDYADYKVGMLYISPFELTDERGDFIIEPLKEKKK